MMGWAEVGLAVCWHESLCRDLFPSPDLGILDIVTINFTETKEENILEAWKNDISCCLGLQVCRFLYNPSILQEVYHVGLWRLRVATKNSQEKVGKEIKCFSFSALLSLYMYIIHSTFVFLKWL